MVRIFLFMTLGWLAQAGSADDQFDLETISELKAGIKLVEDANGTFSGTLFAPLMKLALTQLEFGLESEALDTLYRAQNITHRNGGVYSTQQLPIIDLLSELAMKDKEFAAANRQKRFGFFVATHAYDLESAEAQAAYANLAKWYMQTGQPRRARDIIEDAISIAKKRGLDSLQLEVVKNQTYRLGGNCCSPKNLIAAVKEDRDDRRPEILVSAYLEIADSLTLAGKAQRARAYFELANLISPQNTPPKALAFRRAIETPLSRQKDTYDITRNLPLSTQARLRRLTQQEQIERPNQRPQWFRFDPDKHHKGFETRDLNQPYDREKTTYALIGHPILFSENQLAQILPISWHKKKDELSITMSFTVAETGNLQNIRLVESNAPNRLNNLIFQVLRKTYYRPSLKNGEPAATPDIILVQTFSPREI